METPCPLLSAHYLQPVAEGQNAERQWRLPRQYHIHGPVGHVAEGQNAERQWRQAEQSNIITAGEGWPKGRTPKGNGDVLPLLPSLGEGGDVAEGQNAERQWRLYDRF